MRIELKTKELDLLIDGLMDTLYRLNNDKTLQDERKVYKNAVRRLKERLLSAQDDIRQDKLYKGFELEVNKD